MERKALATEFKVDHSQRLITGYASTFGNRDLVDDVVVSGAYGKTIKERFPRNRIKVLRDHKSPFGIPRHMEEDTTGLLTVTKASETPLGDETLVLVADGVLDSMSIGYETIKADYGIHSDGRKARFLKELKLSEYSVVTFPANEAAIITGVKSLADLDDLFREIKDGAYTPETAARLLHQAADKLLTLPASAPAPEQKAETPEPDPHTDLLAVQSLIRRMTNDIRRAA